MEPIAGDEAEQGGQAQVWHYMLSFTDSVALKCAVELRIADTIHSHGRPISLSDIASCIDHHDDHNSTNTRSHDPPDLTSLARIMRLLVNRKIFTAHNPPDGEAGETLYGMSHASKWLLRDAELTLAPLILIHSHPYLINAWCSLGGCVKRGGSGMNNAYGCELWDLTARDAEFNVLFSEAMACHAKIIVREVLSAYREGFGSIRGTLVDVGGGIGKGLAEIVKEFPHIKGINFDLPHVVAKAPSLKSVSHVGGNMFEAIPSADAVYMQWVMHDWSDELCVKILKNCRKAISGRVGGRVIIVDLVVKEDGKDIFEYGTSLYLDLLMMAHTQGGKERLETEWENILQKGGFPRYNVIKIPAILSIIEAFPAV